MPRTAAEVLVNMEAQIPVRCIGTYYLLCAWTLHSAPDPSAYLFDM